MKKGNAMLPVLVAVVVLVALGAAYFYFRSPSQNTPADTTMHSDDAMQGTKQANSDNVPQESRYVFYTSGLLDKPTDKQRVLFFYANWCPTCRPFDAEIKSRLNDIPENVEIIRVNYNDSDTDAEEDALAQRYGVTYQHTLVVIDSSGNEIKKWNGGDLNRIISELN